MEQRMELGLSASAVELVIDTVCARAEEWPLRPGWTPLLRDPDDEPLVQLAVESGAMCIVTHNVRRLAPVVAMGIAILKAGEFVVNVQAVP